MANCKTQAVSVNPVLLRAQCLRCAAGAKLNYAWSVHDVSDENNVKSIDTAKLVKLVRGGDITGDVLELLGSGNILLERVFEVCVKGT